MLDTMDSLIMIVVVAIATFSTRAFSFIIFPKGKEVPPAVSYLGKPENCTYYIGEADPPAEAETEPIS